MKPEHKKYILENMGKTFPVEIAAKFGLRERNVKKSYGLKESRSDRQEQCP